ncbi:MAG TPA: serine hydrolase [Flavitalea sp.]|nr:serine hydrolase [Flavitalea sp.]
MRRQIIISVFCLCAGLQQRSIAQTKAIIYPDSTWQVATDPEKEGWDNEKLKKLKQFIIDSTHATGVVVASSGRIFFEYGDIRETSYIASCRKSILSMLYGSFVGRGDIDLKTSVAQLQLDDVGGLLPLEKKATIKNLLTARSGVYHPASNEGDASAMAPKRGSVEPGSYWLYNNWDFNIAGYILEQKTRKTIYQLIDSILANPLQMQDWNIQEQRKTGDTTRSKYLAYHMWFSTRDMARIGYLMLRKGRWKDRQILPEDWVKTTTSVVTTNKEGAAEKTAHFNFGYGYLWWVWDTPFNTGAYEGAYSATGAFGQFITVLPKLDLVVAFKTKYEYGRQTPTDLYLRFLDRLVDSKLK